MKTSTGFEFEFDKKALDNMEILDAIDELEANPYGASRIITLLLGKDAKKRLYDHIRTDDGRVPSEAFASEMAEIFKLIEGDLKK